MANDIVDRRYVSRYAQPTFGLQIRRSATGELADADAVPEVHYEVAGAAPEDPPMVLWTKDAVWDSLGSYSVTLASTETATPGVGTLFWDYLIDGVPQTYGEDIEIGSSAPAYDALPPAWQDIVEQVWIRFADLFDSPWGGPHLQVYVQTHFGRNRIAQLLSKALQPLNSASMPHASYPLGGDDFPFTEWGGLLVSSLYIEVVKHLRRSYTEQPEAVLGTAVSRLDRRDYFNRWGEILADEQTEYERDLDRWKRAHMGLGNFSVLVAGGAYGNWGPQINPGGSGAAAARGYLYVPRWH